MKKCKICEINKELSEFYKHPNTKDKVAHYCKECSSNLGKEYRKNNKLAIKDRVAKWYKTDNGKKSVANSAMKLKYGITLDDYDKMLEEQDFKCAICKLEDSRNPIKKGGRFAVDHCHKTGEVRGLLCGKCNMGIGYLNDDISALSEAIKYLSKKS